MREGFVRKANLVDMTKLATMKVLLQLKMTFSYHFLDRCIT